MCPPCQGFSSANSKRDESDPRNELPRIAANLVVKMDPKSVFMEEVPDVLNQKRYPGLIPKLRATFGSRGYDVQQEVQSSL